MNAYALGKGKAARRQIKSSQRGRTKIKRLKKDRWSIKWHKMLPRGQVRLRLNSHH